VSDHPPQQHLLDRRQFVLAVPAGLLVAAGCSGGQDTADARRPEGVPVSQFGASSTAEDVTAGLNLSGRTALVTGATSGLGLETLRVLALRGAHVIATGRTLDRAAAACTEAGATHTSTPLALDLEKWDGIVAAADAVRALGRPVDMLICNAGIMWPADLRLVNGFEQQFAINHLGHFILCHRLLDLVVAAPQGRVVVVSSQLHNQAPRGGIDFDNLDGSRGYDRQRMYGQSKLANALFAFELARRVASTRVTSNALHPGVANTNLDRSNAAWRRLYARLAGWTRPWLKSVEAAAATQVYLATHPALAAVTGRYFEDCNPVVPASPHMADTALAETLWARSEEFTRAYLA
jgi:NAD(P)-dependent dehydrogenase (short-subunit alcohol dehydrogenase family)